MSRSFTVRPNASSTVSRGRGRRGGGPANQNYTSRGPVSQESGIKMNSSQSCNTGNNNDTQLSSQQPAPGTSQEDRMQRRDAYTVITPNEKKRQQISNQAKQEEEAYRRHKEEKKLQHVSYVGTVGGGEIKKEETRQSLQQRYNQTARSPFAKSQKFREAKRKEEDEKLEKMKREQRLKAERNTERDSARHRRHEDDRRAANEAFLARLEQESKQRQQQSRQQKVLATAAATHSHDLGESTETASQNDGTACASGGCSSNSDSPLAVLQGRYPHCDQDVLSDLLLQMNGDINAVCDMLG